VSDKEKESDVDAAVKLAKATPSSPATEPGQDLAEKFGWLPCQLSIEIPVVNFTVGDLLRLGKESIVETACHSTSDIPIKANGLLIARTEFEVIGTRLAVRITELA
jgi:flagellar motor switch/type III secretory pathway protein FliN